MIVRGDTEQNFDFRDPASGQGEDGHPVMIYGIDPGINVRGHFLAPEMWGGIWVIRSGDEGKTWSEPIEVDSLNDRVLLRPHGQMGRLADGTLVFNVREAYRQEEYDKDTNLPRRMTFLYWSRDGGLKWEEPTLIKAGGGETGFLPLDKKDWVA